MAHTFPGSPRLRSCASVSPSGHFTWAKDPTLGSESMKIIDVNEPSVALGWTLGPMGVQRRPGEINLGCRSREIPHQIGEGRGLERRSGGGTGDPSRRSEPGEQKPKDRLSSTCRGARGPSRAGAGTEGECGRAAGHS